MITLMHAAMNDITASAWSRPLREMMQRRWREEQWLSAWKNWALALKYGCSSLKENTQERHPLEQCCQNTFRWKSDDD